MLWFQLWFQYKRSFSFFFFRFCTQQTCLFYILRIWFAGRSISIATQHLQCSDSFTFTYEKIILWLIVQPHWATIGIRCPRNLFKQYNINCTHLCLCDCSLPCYEICISPCWCVDQHFMKLQSFSYRVSPAQLPDQRHKWFSLFPPWTVTSNVSQFFNLSMKISRTQSFLSTTNLEVFISSQTSIFQPLLLSADKRLSANAS